MATHHTKRLASLIQAKIAQYLSQKTWSFMINITETKLTSDMGYLDIYFTSFDYQEGHSTNSQKVMNLLKNETPLLRQHIAHEVKMRRIPYLRFHWDESLLEARKIDTLLSNIKEIQP